MADARTLTVLHEEEGIVAGDLFGAKNPVLVLDDQTMSSLLIALRDAQARALALRSKEDVGSILDLCTRLGRIIEVYAVTRNKFVGGVSPSVETANALREIERLAKELERFHKT